MEKRSSIRHRYLAILLFGGMLMGCTTVSSQEKTDSGGNEIVTFTVPKEGKEIVKIGFATPMKWDAFMAALDEKFPDKQFIYDFNYSAGNGLPLSEIRKVMEKNDYDLVVGNTWNAPTLGADISDQPFLSNYQTTVLDSIKSEGRVYGIPLPTSPLGIAYNKDLFTEKGWNYPTSTDEFATLVKTIQAAGITPYDSCLKYSVQVTRNLEGMLYDELFTKPEGLAWYQKLIQGNATFAEYATPLFETAKKLFDEGIFTIDDFSASLTAQRKNFFAGKSAMLDYSTDIYVYATTENCPFEIGFGGYPSTTGSSSPVLYSTASVMFIPSKIKNDAKRFSFDTSIMDYISTTAGQDALLTGWTGVPSLSNYSGSDKIYEKMTPFIKNGAYHAVFDFAADQAMTLTLQNLVGAAVKSIGEGTPVQDAIAALDRAYSAVLKTGVVDPVYNDIALATDDFSVLETSYYLAGKIKEATAADVALMPSGGYYRSNMAYFSKGNLQDDVRMFYEKGIGPKDFITTYSLTGAQLKSLLEHPIINGAELNQFIAPSGLNLTYAPWHKAGNRIVSASFEDGTSIDEAKTYRVAAYAGVIDKSYITETLKSFPELLDPQSFVIASLKKDQSVSPNLKGRLTLRWDIAQ